MSSWKETTTREEIQGRLHDFINGVKTEAYIYQANRLNRLADARRTIENRLVETRRIYLEALDDAVRLGDEKRRLDTELYEITWDQMYTFSVKALLRPVRVLEISAALVITNHKIAVLDEQISKLEVDIQSLSEESKETIAAGKRVRKQPVVAKYPGDPLVHWKSFVDRSENLAHSIENELAPLHEDMDRFNELEHEYNAFNLHGYPPGLDGNDAHIGNVDL